MSQAFGKQCALGATLLVLCALVGGAFAAMPIPSNGKTERSAEHNATIYLEQHCQRVDEVLVKEPVTVRLQSLQANPTTADAPLSCKAHVGFRAASANHSLLITMRAFNLAEREPSGVCLKQFLQLSGGQMKPKRMCHQLETLKVDDQLVTDESDADIYYFRSTQLLPEHDLELTVAPVFRKEHDKECPEGVDGRPETRMFECHSDGLCVHSSLRCDRTPNCLDGSDELACLHSGDGQTSVSPNKKTHIMIGVGGGTLIIALVGLVAFGGVRYHSNKKTQGRGEFTQVSSREPAAEGTRDDSEAARPTTAQASEV